MATVLALSSAGLHAGWNLLLKTSDERDLAGWGQFLFGGLLALGLLVFAGPPGMEAVPYLCATGIVHVAYILGLVAAYTHGDFSLAYPLARGGGALLAALGGAVLLSDQLGVSSWIAVAVVAAGLISLVGRGATRASVGWACFTAATIATYSLIDAGGARASVSGVSYGLATIPAAAFTISIAMLLRGRGTAFVAVCRVSWPRFLMAGAFVTVAYTMVMVAVRLAPVGYVVMLRESSVVIGALLGWLFLHEALGRHRVVSSGIIVAGMVGLVAVNL